MIARQFTITYEDGTVSEVPSKQFDLVKLERHFGKPAPLIFGKGTTDEAGMPFEAFMFLAYVAAVRGQEEPPSFDAWGETVTNLDVEMDDEEEDADTPLDSTP